jgi:hypothetical protein
VQTRIYIEFPVIPCTKEDFKDCILLDPITALASTVDNAEQRGHRQLHWGGGSRTKFFPDE